MVGMILDKSKSGFQWKPLFYKVWVHPLQRVAGGEGGAFAIIYSSDIHQSRRQPFSLRPWRG